MKTHLPVALRKALIAALVAVSVSEYNQAQAAMNLNMDAAAVSNVCEVNTLDVELTGSLAGGNHQITSTTGNLDINTDSDLDGDYEIKGVGNSFKTESGYIKAGSVEGNETRFETVSGDIITGDIISDGNSFKTESGSIETGDITGNNTTLEVTGEGAISTGEITGSGTRIQAEHSTLENISNMEGVTMTVGGIEATAADTNATLKATEITSTGNVTIGADDAVAEETDTLTLKENSSIKATGTDDGAGNVTHATMKIDQNVALAGGSSLSTTGGDVTVTGHVAVSNAGTISSDQASVSIGSLGDASDNLKITAGKDVAIGAIANTPEAPPKKSYTDAVAGLQVTAGGTVQIGASAGSLLDASIKAQGAITIGQPAESSKLLEVHDSTTGKSLISTQDDLTVNQSIRIDATGGDRVVIKAAGGMLFKGENTHMHGDSTSVIVVKSVESIVFSSPQGTDIGTGVIVKTKGEDSDISVDRGEASINLVAGKMYALKGAVRIDGGINQILSDVDNPTLQAQDGIEVTAGKENTLDNALLQTVAGGIELESDPDSGMNMVYDSALSVTREGNITVSGHENYLKTATGKTVDGKIILTAGALNKIDVSTRLEATQEVEIAAGTNNLIRDASVVKSKQAGIDITAATGGNQITGAGTKVAASGAVTIGAETNNLIEAGATVLSDTDNIGISADGENQITDTRVEAQQMVKIEAGTNNLISDAAVVKSKQAGIDITAATGRNQITGDGTKVAASGAVTIGAATNNLIEAGATVLSDTDKIGISADGENQITGTDTRVEAQQAVTIEADTNNLISNAAVVKSKQAGIDMTAATGGNQITGAGTKVAASGAVTIGAASNNLVDAGAAVLSDTDNVIISAAGGNFVQNAATVNAGGTGYIYLNGGTTATNVVRHDGTELTAGGNIDMSGAQNIISNSAKLDSGKNVNLVAENTADSTVAVNRLVGSEVSADGAVTLLAGGSNVVDSSAIDTTSGNIIIKAPGSNFVQNAATVNAGGTGYIYLNGGTTATNVVRHAGTELTAGGNIDMSGAQNIISNSAKLDSGKNVNLVAENTADSTVAVNKLVGSEVSADGAVTLLAGGSNVVDSSAIDTTSGNIIIKAPGSNFVQNAATVNAGGTGYIYLNGGTTATNVVRHDGTDLTAGGNVDMSGAQNIISDSAKLDSGKNVNLVAAERNYVDKATILADGMIGALGVTNVVNQESQVRATAGITIYSTGSSADDGNLITGGSSVVSETDKVHILAGMSNEISGTDTRVEAQQAVTIEAGTNNLIGEAAVVKSKQAGIDITAATGGNQITGTDTRVEAQQAVTIEASTNNLIGEAAVVKSKQAGIDITAATGGNQITGAGTKVAASGPVTISAATNNTVSDGAFVRAENAGIGITGEAVNTIDGSEVKAQGGALTMGNENLTTDTVENRIRNAAAVTASENVELTGDANAISGASSVEAGLHVTMTADTQNAVVDSTVTAKAGNITLSDVGSSVASLQNVVTSSAGETTTLTAGGNVTIAGENIITGTDPGATRITAENGSISIHDDNYIRNVALEARGAEGDVSIITGAGKDTWIEDSSISGETVLIAGDVADGRSDDKLAVVTGDAMEIISRGEDDGAGITLNNVSVQDTVRNEPNIMAQNDGNIILRNRVDLENGTLSIENAATSTGRISVDGDTVLNMKAASTLNGRLTGAGIINKSGGDELLLNYDHTSFNGTIYANGSHSGNPADGSVADSANPGSWITISGAGVGSGASIVLKNTDLVITAPGAQIGTLDTTWDEAGVNNEHLTGGTLISDGSSSDGSYTKDGNSRADFTTVGSVLEVNKAAPGDVVAASDMNLSDATLIKLNAEIAEDGSASSDVIRASGTINAAARTGLNSTSTATAPSTARVYVMHNEAAATAAEGARTTIMQGTMATDINEDVLYDVAESGNGTYQRILQERNVHLENGGNHVDLVYSKNYRSASKTPQMQQVANALREISDTFHHSEGTLAASPNRLHNLIDAFDYTRSEGAAQRGLQSVAGTGNVLPRLMMFDSSRRHLENLRGQMLMPVCADANGMGGVVRRNNVWMTYTSSHDELCGDAYLEDYSRSANGAMLGIDRSVNCKLRVGLSLGYEESTGKSGSSRIEADTFFVDAYAAGVTGRFKHRASVGLATSSFDTNRNVLVEAGYHTFVGTGKGSVDSLSLNFGYEISTDYKLSETATLTPYAALNLSWHKLDTMRERGMGEAGLVTAYDNEWQSEIILGVSYNRLFTVLRNQAPALFYADAAMHLELFNDRVSVKNRFLGASASWRAESMNRQPLYFELGVGVAVPLSPGWTATAGAAYEIGPDRAGVSGNVGVRYSF